MGLQLHEQQVHAPKQGARAALAAQTEAMEGGTLRQVQAESKVVAAEAAVLPQAHAAASAQSALFGPVVRGLSPQLERRTNNEFIHTN